MPSPSRASHLGRVAGKVAPLVVKFFRELGVGTRFHLFELENFVTKWSNVAPGSGSRIMRAMRKAKAIGYRLVSRTDSAYEVTKVDGDERETPTLPGVE